MSAPPTHSHSINSLSADLAKLGVSHGDVVFVHSSFKSIGQVTGGAAAVVAALESALGPAGTLMMPSFNLVKENREANWNIATTPSTVGWLTEFFRQMPETVRSEHYSHSVAARGRLAKHMTDGHLADDGMSSPWDLKPWGRTFGEHSPFVRARGAGGKILMLGVDYHSSTFMHLIETMHWNQRLATFPKAEYQYMNRKVAGEYWDGLEKLSRGLVGDAPCRLFPIREFTDTVLAAAKKEPTRFYKWWKDDV